MCQMYIDSYSPRRAKLRAFPRGLPKGPSERASPRGFPLGFPYHQPSGQSSGQPLAMVFSFLWLLRVSLYMWVDTTSTFLETHS